MRSDIQCPPYRERSLRHYVHEPNRIRDSSPMRLDEQNKLHKRNDEFNKYACKKKLLLNVWFCSITLEVKCHRLTLDRYNDGQIVIAKQRCWKLTCNLKKCYLFWRFCFQLLWLLFLSVLDYAICAVALRQFHYFVRECGMCLHKLLLPVRNLGVTHFTKIKILPSRLSLYGIVTTFVVTKVF